MKKLILGLFFTIPLSILAQENIEIKIKTDSDLTGIATATYIATQSGPHCLDFSIDEYGNPQRRTKIKYLKFQETKGLIVIPNYLESRCQFKRVDNISLAFEVINKFKANNAVSVYLGQGDAEIQIINCQELVYNNKISCYGDIRTTNAGKATVLVVKN